MGGWGGQKIFFPKFNQIWCVSFLHEWHTHRRHFFGPRALGPWVMPRGGTWAYRGGLGGQKFFFSEIQPDFVFELLT